MIPHWVADILLGLVSITAGLALGFWGGWKVATHRASSFLWAAASKIPSIEGRAAIKETLRQIGG